MCVPTKLQISLCQMGLSLPINLRRWKVWNKTKQNKTLFCAQPTLTERMCKTTEHKQNSSSSDLFRRWFFSYLLIFLRNIHLERKNAFSSITKEASLWNPVFVLHNVDLCNLQRILSEVHKQKNALLYTSYLFKRAFFSSSVLIWSVSTCAKLRSNHCNNWLRIPTEILRKEHHAMLHR